MFTLYDSNANTSKDQRVGFSGQCSKANKSMGVISGLGMFMRNNPELAEKDVSGFVKPLDQRSLILSSIFVCFHIFCYISLCQGGNWFCFWPRKGNTPDSPTLKRALCVFTRFLAPLKEYLQSTF